MTNGIQNQLYTFFEKSKINNIKTEEGNSITINSPEDLKVLAEKLAQPGSQSVKVNVGRYTFSIRDNSSGSLSVTEIDGSDRTSLNHKNSENFGISRESYYAAQLKTSLFDKVDVNEKQNASSVSISDAKEDKFTIKSNGSFKYAYNVQGTATVNQQPKLKPTNIGIIFDNSLSIPDGSDEEKQMIANLNSHVTNDIPVGSKVTLTGVCTPDASASYELVEDSDGNIAFKDNGGNIVQVQDAFKHMRTGNKTARSTTPLYKSIKTTANAVGKSGSLEIWTDFSGSDIDKDNIARPESMSAQQEAFEAINNNGIKANAFIVGSETEASQFEGANNNLNGDVQYHKISDYSEIGTIDYKSIYADQSIKLEDMEFGCKVKLASNDANVADQNITTESINSEALPVSAATTHNVVTNAKVEGEFVFKDGKHSFEGLTVNGKKIVPGHNFNIEQIGLQAQKGKGQKTVEPRKTAMLIDQSGSMATLTTDGTTRKEELKSALATLADSNLIHITNLAGMDDDSDAPIYFTDESPEFNSTIEKEIIKESANHKMSFDGTPLTKSISSYVEQLSSNDFNNADQLDVVTDGLPVNDIVDDGNIRSSYFRDFQQSVTTLKGNNKPLNFVMMYEAGAMGEIKENYSESELSDLANVVFSSSNNPQDLISESLDSKGMRANSKSLSSMLLLLSTVYTGGEMHTGESAISSYLSATSDVEQTVSIDDPSDKVTGVKVTGSFPDEPDKLYEFTMPVTKK